MTQDLLSAAIAAGVQPDQLAQDVALVAAALDRSQSTQAERHRRYLRAGLMG